MRQKAIAWATGVGAAALLVVALIAVRVDAAAPGVSAVSTPALAARDAVVRLAAVSGRPAAGYLTVTGGPAKLTGVTSPLASRIELHSSGMANGMMTMAPMASASVAPGTPLNFAPGGNHLMIFGLPATVKAGAMIPLVLSFADGRTLTVEAHAAAPGAMLGHGSH